MTNKTLNAPCWHRLPTNDDEKAALAEWDGHYTTMADLVANHDDGTGLPVLGEAFTAPCRVLSCDDCDEEALNDDTGGVVHFPPDCDPDVMFVSAFEEWGDRVLCEACREKAERDELRKVGG